ncbi:MAG: bacillithiol biosynthesis BshC [Candidatus Kapabacteria bacterium]|nr:bacillithiol biosynthesis BshC [Candidatus Kapabacteria bacterium]
MKLIDHEVIGTNSVARDFIAGREPISSRFPNRTITLEFCRKRSWQGASRSRLRQLAEQSMAPMMASDRQLASLDLLGSPESVVVATGQQIGMMGGPMYTLYKIRSAVAECRLIKASLGVEAVPVFWMEDNDHDAAEASQVLLPGADGLPSTITTWDGADPRMPVSMRRVDSAMHASVADAAAMLRGRYAESTRTRVLDAWAPETSWGDAFLMMLAPYLQRWGVLVVRASHIIESGMHAPLVMREVEELAITKALQEGSQRCLDMGLSVQAKPADFGFFVIDASGRRRPDALEAGLAERARNAVAQFSPSVLTRPLVQDAILPTVGSVLGAAELAYHAQLCEAYAACGIEMPVPMLRHGATLLTPKIARLVAKADTVPANFLRSWSTIERELAMQLTQDMFPDAQAKDAEVDRLLAPYHEAAERTDVTLVPTVAAQRSGIRAALDALEGKIRSAIKKRNTATLDRARTIHSALMPNDTLQERVFSLATWESQIGVEALCTALDVFDAVGLGHHVLIDIPSEQTPD